MGAVPVEVTRTTNSIREIIKKIDSSLPGGASACVADTVMRQTGRGGIAATSHSSLRVDATRLDYLGLRMLYCARSTDLSHQETIR